MSQFKCSKCKEVKDSSEFHKSKRRSTGFESRCKACTAEYHKGYYKQNSEKIKQQSKDYFNANIESVHKRHSKYYQENKDWLYLLHREWFINNIDKNREYHRNFQKKLRDTNPEISLEKCANRRARIKNSIPKWANRDNIRSLYKQAKQMSKLDDILYHVDHIIPLSHPLVCGLHTEDNLRIITSEENHKKTNKLLDEVYLLLSGFEEDDKEEYNNEFLEMLLR